MIIGLPPASAAVITAEGRGRSTASAVPTAVHATRNTCDPGRRHHQGRHQPDRHPPRIERQQHRNTENDQEFGAGPQIVDGRRSGYRHQQHNRTRLRRSALSSGVEVVVTADPPSAAAAAVGTDSSAPSRKCRVRGHRSSSPAKSCEMTTTVRPRSRRRSSSSRSRPRWLAASRPRQRLVEDQRPRRTRQQSGQHHAAHLATAELVDAPLGQRGIQPDDAERRGHTVLRRGAKSPLPKPLPGRRGCASTAAGPPGTTTPPRRPARVWACHPSGRRRSWEPSGRP